MEIKKPKWDECIGSSTSIYREYTPGEPIDIIPNIEVGSHVGARYGNNSVDMTIIEKQSDDIFVAKINFFSPINVSPPNDLSEGDHVLINRNHICWILD